MTSSADRTPPAEPSRGNAASEGGAVAGRWANRGVAPRDHAGTGWVVVADEAIARILATTDVAGVLEPVEELTDPAAHAREGDLHVNDGGRRGGAVSHDSGRSGGRGGRTSAGSTSITASAGEENAHLEARDFARRVARHLATALQQKRFATLRIVAAPRFLGLLRQEIDAPLKATIVAEIDKDLIHAADDDIARRVLGGASG